LESGCRLWITTIEKDSRGGVKEIDLGVR